MLSSFPTKNGSHDPTATIHCVQIVVAIVLLHLAPVLATAQPLMITAPAAPGGGWDQTARAMQRVLTDIEPGATVQVENVPGAAGTMR
jgi:putative tricarboxylic transport membrane protein